MRFVKCAAPCRELKKLQFPMSNAKQRQFPTKAGREVEISLTLLGG